ncbi:hypothetical protein, partial [Acinetobacter bereziniae]
QVTGLLNGSVTVDNRLLTESGRAQIIQEQKDLPENFRQSAENLAKALPDGVYKDKALQTLNNIQAKLYNLPAEYKETGVVGSYTASELLKRGMEPQDVEALFNQLDFFYTAKEFSEIQDQLNSLVKSGVNLETVFREPKAGVSGQETVYAQGTDFETKVTTQQTLGMSILSNIADLGNNIKDISETTGVDIEKVQLAVGLVISGPVRLAIEYGKSMAFDSVVGDKVAQGFNLAANALTAAAHDTSINTIENWTNPEKINALSSSNGENKEKSIKFAKEVQNDKQGADYLIGAAAGIIGVGVGKGIAKGKEENISTNSSSIETKVPDYVTRNDHDFSATENYKGKPKAHINENGDLVAANPDGIGSIQSHIRGSNPEKTPYISTTDPKFSQESKNYGGEQIQIDTKRLQQDIDAGKIKNTQIIPHQDVKRELQSKVDAAKEKYDRNPSDKNEKSLTKAEQDLNNAIRDGECLIKGCIPADYIKK